MRLHPTRIAALLAIAPLAAGAHPGHDVAPPLGFVEGLAHLLAQPGHVAMLAGALLVGVLALRAAACRHARTPRP